MSTGRVHTSVNINNNDDISICSVPYRIVKKNSEDNDYHILVYDNLKKEDVVSIYKNRKISIETFEYYSLDSKIYVNVGTTDVVSSSDVEASLKIKFVYNNTWKEISPEKISITSMEDMSNSFSFTVDISDVDIPKFVFMFVNLDADDRVILPIYTELSKDRRDTLVEQNLNFSALDYNSLVGSNVSKTGSAETSSKDMYVVATGTRDSLEIKKSGELPFLWTEAYKYHSEEGSESNPTCWYGKVRKNSIEINLTELGLTDGDLYTIQCGNTILESNKEYSSSENQNESGDSIYSVSFDNGMSLSPYCLDSENMSSPLYTRTYLLKYLNAPFNIDLKEEYN